jgi:hypothetical protein
MALLIRNDRGGLVIDTSSPDSASEVGIRPIPQLPGDTDVQKALEDLAIGESGGSVTPIQLAATTPPSGASLVGIQDVGNHYTATQVEGALQEVGASLATKPNFAILASHLANEGANLIGVQAFRFGPTFTSTTVEGILEELNDHIGLRVITTDLAGTDPGQGASTVGIQDVGGFFTGTTVEDALAELATGEVGEVTTAQLAATTIPSGASLVGIHDAGGLITATNVETAFQEVATNIAANTAAIALRVTTANLASTALGLGASLVGINDAGGLITATQVEAALQEIFTSNALKQTIADPSVSTISSGNVVQFTLLDAVTNAVSPIMRVAHTSTGTTAPGFGGALDFWLQADNGTLAVASRMQSVWLDPAIGSLDAAWSLVQRTGAGFSETFQNSHFNSKSSAGSVALPGWCFLTDGTSGMSLPGGSILNLGFGGAAQLGMQSGAIGFLAQSATPVVAASIGATLTNNVALTGSANVLPDFTNGAVYATDYASLHATISQMAAKLTAIETQLKALGLTIT